MFQQHKKVETETKWIKLGKTTEITFVGKETLAIINECHILFYDIGLKKNFIYNANCEEHGDGVQCLAGHRTMPMFAFAEKCYNPRILLFTYPNFTPISIIKGVCPDGYTNLVFSELEYIVSLSTFPQFIITVWCWRTGVKLAWKESGITQSGQQLLRCSLSSPVIVSQMLEMSECLLLWEINVCSKRCMLSKNQVFLPEAKSCCGFIWAPEGILHIVTKNGDVYTVDAETHKAHLAIAWLTHNTDNANQQLDDKTLIEEASQYFETKNEGEEDKQGVTKNKETEDKNINNSNVSPCIAWFKGGIVVAGPDSYIKHFKRTSKVWKETWSILLNIQLVKLEACSLKDYLIGISDRGELYQYMPTMLTPTFERVQHYGSNFTHVCLIKPQCEMLATLSSNGIIDVWNKTTGGHVGTMSLEAKYLCMVSSPKLPYIVLGRCDGVVDFLNVFCPESPQVLCQVSLCAWEIQDVQFTLSGSLLVAANTTNGDFFLIKANAGDRMEVLSYTSCKQEVTDFTVLESKQGLHLLVLVSSQKCCKAGLRIIVYEKLGDERILSLKGYVELAGYYVGLSFHPEITSRFFGVLHRSKQIHVMEFTSETLECRIVNVAMSGHKLRKFTLTSNEHHLLSYGADGLVILHSPDSEKCIGTIMPHHRTTGGVRFAVADALNYCVITLGQDGSLIGSVFKIMPDLFKERKLQQAASSPEINTMFTVSTTSGFYPTEKGLNKTWLDLQEDIKLMYEKMASCAERTKIKEDFVELQKKLVALLDNNYKSPPKEQLKIKDFNLDIDTRERKIAEAEKEREERRNYLISLCEAQDRLCSMLKIQFWDSMDVKGRTIKAISGCCEVDNYPLLPIDPAFEERLKNVIQRRNIELIVNKDFFRPWEPTTTSTIKLQLAKDPLKQDEDEAGRIKKALLAVEDSLEDEEREKITDLHVLSGSGSYEFTDPSPLGYSQYELVTYLHLYNQNTLLKSVCQECRLWFNNKFDDMYDQKEREISMVVERNERLRYILSELREDPTHVEDPEWTPEERPLTIMKVEEWEVPVRPYVSPSEQDILDLKMAEEEAHRLAEMADNFRELALINMMNGVLEVRWEEEIKKDIPLPKCMVEKQPEEFDEDDLRVVMEYEEKVKFLMSERERYKKMLDQERIKLTTARDESVRKFNSRLADLYQTKLKVDSAINAEILKILRARLLCYNRALLDKKERDCMSKIEEKEKIIESLQEDIQQLQKLSSECRGIYESQVNRDKSLEKNFKKDFPDMPALVLEQLSKIYKKRPKMHQRIQTSVALMSELSRCSVSGEKPIFLIAECLDYLKGLDTLDSFSNASPNTSEETWAILCRIRRLKVESELKMKALSLEVTEADATVNVFQKKMIKNKEMLTSLQGELQVIRKEKLHLIHNLQIQLVIKQGLVEIDIQGFISDFEDAILINRVCVDRMNEEIKKAGQRKLRTMHETTNFRRGILCKEWEHKKLRMEIEDLKEHLHTLEGIKVTKDIQMYLRRQAQGMSQDKTTSIEKEIQLLREFFDKAMFDAETHLRDLDNKIEKTLKANRELDGRVIDLNVDVNEQNLKRDTELEVKNAEGVQRRMSVIVKRSQLITKIQEQYNDILVMQTELELLRLKTFPTLKYKTLF